MLYGRFNLALISAGWLAVVLSARAAEEPNTSVFELGTVEVIGTRAGAASTLSTDIVDADQLAARQAVNLSQALDLVPGITLQNQGQRRERLVYLRGFSSRQVPLFIDGVPVYVPYDGNIDLERFGVDYISQIIVSKGLASLLYGPNTLGGAINVVSRKPSETFEASAKIASEWDDHLKANSQRATTSVGGLQGAWYAHLTASWTNSDGYRLPDDFTRQTLVSTANPADYENGGRRDHADSRDTLISAKIGYAPDADNEYALSLYRQDGRKEDPLYSGNYLRSYPCPTQANPNLACTRQDGVQVRYWQWPWWDKQSVYWTARNAIGEQGTLRWRLFHDSFKNSLESYDDASYTTQARPYAFHGSQYDDYSAGGNADFEWRWNAANVTRIASHYKYDVHRESQTAPALPQTRLEAPIYDFGIEHDWHPIDTLTLTPGYSHMVQQGRTAQVYSGGAYKAVTVDDAEADNAQLVSTWQLDTQHSLLAGISRKTRFPSLKERFSGGLGTMRPNPALGPERAMHYELGFQQRAAHWGGKIALFRSDVNDAIQGVSVPPGDDCTANCMQNQNVGKQRNRGIEISLDATPWPTLQLNGQFNLLDRDNISSPSVKPTNTPQYKYSAAADWNFLQQWHLRLNAQHESKRYSTDTGTRVAGAFTLANAFVRFEPVRQLGVEIGARNVTDELYAYEEGYFESGRTYLLQVDYRY